MKQFRYKLESLYESFVRKERKNYNENKDYTYEVTLFRLEGKKTVIGRGPRAASQKRRCLAPDPEEEAQHQDARLCKMEKLRRNTLR